MTVDFLASVDKSSGTSFNTPGSSGAPASGFLDQINRAMRDDDRKNEPTVEKKPVVRKKTLAAAESRNSVKAGEKTDTTKKTDKPDYKNTDKEAASARTSDRADETSRPKFMQTGEDSEFYNVLGAADVSETENVQTFAPIADETSDTENAYTFAFPDADASETENAYTSTHPVEEITAPDDFADPSVSSSTDALFFSPTLINDGSGFTAMMNMNTALDNAAAGAAAVGTELISQMAAGRQAATPLPETADAGVPQNASLSGSEAEAGAKELLKAMTGDLESANGESARQDVKELLENGLFTRNQAAEQNPDRNAAASSRDSARFEIQTESKTTVNAESELSNQSPARASLENEALLMERLTAQTVRSREGAAFTNASENAGRTVQVAETSIQVTSGAAKAEPFVPTRSVSASDQEFVIELAGRIQAQIRGGREMIRIQLHPEDLGRLEIRAESGRNGIIARIAAESTDVKKLLESNIQSLQQTLEARGLKIDRLHIVVEENAYAAFADAGRYGHAGAGSRNSEVSEFSRSNGARIESQQEDAPDDLSVEAERRGAGFYTVG